MSDSVAIIVLAAGGSARLGRAKQLLRFEGQTLLRRAVDAACGCASGPVIVVLGARITECRAALANDLDRVTIVENERWADGVSTSIRAGVAAALRVGCDAAILMTCDQPFVDATHLRLLIDRSRATRCAAVASAYGDTVGVPALFDRSVIPQLAALDGDRGAKGLIESLRPDVAIVPFPSGALDIDTPGDADMLGRP